jgi:hypothetical protein
MLTLTWTRSISSIKESVAFWMSAALPVLMLVEI